MGPRPGGDGAHFAQIADQLLKNPHDALVMFDKENFGAPIFVRKQGIRRRGLLRR